MILTEFSKYLQKNEDKIIDKQSCTLLLGHWIKEILERKPKTNVEKIIHAEITLAKNEVGNFLLVAKSESGQILTNSLYNFALSYEHQIIARWLEDKKATDFKQ